MREKIHVLMTGGGSPGAAGIIQCLQKDKRIKLTVCDANENVVGKYLNQTFFKTLAATHKNFIPFMMNECKARKVDVLFPLVTAELNKLSFNKTLFQKQGTRVIVSDFETLEIANDKGLLHQHLLESKISVADFRIVNSLFKLKNAFTELGFPKQAVCVKPTKGNGSRGVRIIDNNADEFDLMFYQKPNSLFMSYHDLLRILKQKKFPELLVAEVLPGEEFTIDTLMNNGKCLLIVPRKRIKMNNGISVEGEIVNQKQIVSYVKKIAATLRLHGPVGFQVKRDQQGKFKLLEINPRIQGTSVALMGAGINLPLIAVLQEAKIKFQVPSVKWGTRFIRYYSEIYFQS